MSSNQATSRQREKDRDSWKETSRRLIERMRDSDPQAPFDPSVGLLCHPCIRTTHLSYSFLSLKFPPPPCAVLLVTINNPWPYYNPDERNSLRACTCFDCWCIILTNWCYDHPPNMAIHGTFFGRV